MIRPRRTGAAALLLALVAPLSAQDAGHRLTGPFLLRFHPPAGARYGLVQERDVRVRSDSGSSREVLDQHLRTRMYSVQEVAGPAAGGVAITTRIDSAVAEAELPTGGTHREEMGHLRGTTGRLLYDERMRLVRAEFRDASVADNFKTFEVASFPARAVAEGDSWDEMLALPLDLPGLDEPVTVRARMTLREVRLDAGDTTVVIALGVRMPEKPLAVQEGDARFAMTLKGEWTGEWRYSLTRGATVAMDVGGSVLVEIENRALLGQPIAMRLDQRLSQRLVSPPRVP